MSSTRRSGGRHSAAPRAAALAALALAAQTLSPVPGISQDAGGASGTTGTPAAAATVPRAIPAPVAPPEAYRLSMERGWRSADGSPGHAYWQQGTAYDVEARLEPETGRLEGTVRIRYAHNAPIGLNTVWLHLHQNFHTEGVIRNAPAEITGGMTLSRVAASGQELEERESLAEGPGYRVDGTLMELRPTGQLAQGDTLALEIGFSFTVPQAGIDERMGHSENRDTYFIAYWFPKMAVLDDLHVWDAEPFLGRGEFHDGFGDYTVALSVPEHWSVMGTGTLDNAEEVLSPLTLERLEAAATADTLVTIAAQGERSARTVTRETPDSTLTYRFTATNVRDFAWTASDAQRWDATSAIVPDRDEDGTEDRVLIHSFWHEDSAPLWAEAWRYGKQSVEYHSRYTELAYPWPHMTFVEGGDIIGGGMEYPMLTMIGAYEGEDGQTLFNTVSHEVAHMWVPMIVSSNEKRWAWMDEGSATFLEHQSRMELWPGVDHHRVEARTYLQLAGTAAEQSMMRHADWYEPGNGYAVAAYYKPAALMMALREVIGAETWDRAYRAFLSEWAFKHPTPWDFFSTVERFAERDLDWLWTSFWYETWTLDHAVGDVRMRAGSGATVVIEDRGLAPFPAKVRIRTTGGGTIERDVPVEHWLAGNRSYEITLEPSAGAVTRVELDPAGYAPDVDRSNNLWPRG
ncbi:MAG TPA: M1 family metallopeptidase [Longimicrobiales bacterium]|nr:M1 family metallopeptidase [Longimicrobiales bacterium]